MSDINKQLAELKSIRDIAKRQDISAYSADGETIAHDEWEGELAGLGRIKYKCLRKQRFNVECEEYQIMCSSD
ncbi:hypothetical protein FF38_12400 [Lucilia cuprina]|uniref:Uncharacterized protein n=1 Tax=Lucilia cuprina TaxID=7375 RepID=A0A0L0CHU7_LUCCU|nr:hypothetical protein FF38_12400 [Lucilia cuprina]